VKGQVFALREGETTIGREPANGVWIADPSVSRAHCVLRVMNTGRVQITDRDSRNGTFVNGIPVRDRILEENDQIKIGTSVFVFTAATDDSSTISGVRLEEEQVDADSLVRLRRDECVYLEPEAIVPAAAPSVATAKALQTLFRIGTAVHGSRDMDELASRIPKLLCEAIPAEHCAVLLYERWSPEPVSAYSWSRAKGEDAVVSIHRSLVDHALQEGIAVLSNTASGSVLAVPLFGRERPLGMIYLDSGDAQAAMDRDHLQLATAVGLLAGAALENVRYADWLRSENQRLQAEVSTGQDMVGGSVRMREVHQFVARVARTDSTVLIRGESGTGKELVARAIHRHSTRSEQPFVAINCASLTETLLESELFGHERGAFTGATAQKKGKLEVAEGGTIFLDEIGELPPAIQAKLLRVLQEREFERVGGLRPIQVDVRLLAATNRDLEAAVSGGAVRQDLYYRINVISVTLPPLRERRDDIPLLAGYFAAKCARRARRAVAGISPEARAYLLGYDWPGNVRELENAIERAVVLGSTDLILPEDLPDSVLEATSPPSGAPEGYHDAVRRAKKETILAAILSAGGNHTEAARLLGLQPTYLHRLIRNLHLKTAIRNRPGTGAGYPKG
jgi:Nif-specific regulatory protein